MMRRGCIVAITILMWSCSSNDNCLDSAKCSSSAKVAMDASAPPDCDVTKSPKDSPACIDDSIGVFIAPSGDDGMDGNKNAPVRTIAKGLTLAASRGLPRLYVCEGSYPENVEVKLGISVYGGLSCAWAYNGAKPKIAPPKGVALRVMKVSAAVVVEDVEIVGAADTNSPGDSAIAVFVSESSNVRFRNATLTAGEGIAGVKGESRSNYSGTAMAGGSANAATGGTGSSCVCMDATASKGGNGAAGSGAGLSDGTATPAVGVSNAGASGTTTCVDGQRGSNGLPNGSGQPWAPAGTLSTSGWAPPTKPASAPNGNPAQGGGGGGAKTSSNFAGGGGCGGCGGAGGEPGSAGGSSFALVSFNSNVTLEVGTLMRQTSAVQPS